MACDWKGPTELLAGSQDLSRFCSQSCAHVLFSQADGSGLSHEFQICLLGIRSIRVYHIRV